MSGSDPSSDSIGVPWYKPSAEVEGAVNDLDEGKKAAPRGPFIHCFFIPKHTSEDGKSYVATFKNGTGRAEYLCNDWDLQDDAFERRLTVNAYPPPSFERRVTLNSWRSTLMLCLLDAGFRVATLQTNMHMMLALFDNAIYSGVSWILKGSFIGLYIFGCVLWACLAMWTVAGYRQFLHPDSRWGSFGAFAGHTVCVMLSVPNDIALAPIHFLPFQQGGLLASSECVEGNTKWPVHTISHQSKLDHDYMNTTGLRSQIPLFFCIDVGCALVNLNIAHAANKFSYMACLQLIGSFTFALVKISRVLSSCRQRRRLLDLWTKIACDPKMSDGRRKNASYKYLAEGGNREHLRVALQCAHVGEATAAQLAFRAGRSRSPQADRSSGSFLIHGNRAAFQEGAQVKRRYSLERLLKSGILAVKQRFSVDLLELGLEEREDPPADAQSSARGEARAPRISLLTCTSGEVVSAPADKKFAYPEFQIPSIDPARDVDQKIVLGISEQVPAAHLTSTESLKKKRPDGRKKCQNLLSNLPEGQQIVWAEGVSQVPPGSQRGEGSRKVHGVALGAGASGMARAAPVVGLANVRHEASYQGTLGFRVGAEASGLSQVFPVLGQADVRQEPSYTSQQGSLEIIERAAADAMVPAPPAVARVDVRQAATAQHDTRGYTVRSEAMGVAQAPPVAGFASQPPDCLREADGIARGRGPLAEAPPEVGSTDANRSYYYSQGAHGPAVNLEASFASQAFPTVCEVKRNREHHYVEEAHGPAGSARRNGQADVDSSRERHPRGERAYEQGTAAPRAQPEAVSTCEGRSPQPQPQPPRRSSTGPEEDNKAGAERKRRGLRKVSHKQREPPATAQAQPQIVDQVPTKVADLVLGRATSAAFGCESTSAEALLPFRNAA